MDVLDGYGEHVKNIMSEVDKVYIEGMRAINRQERIDVTARAAMQSFIASLGDKEWANQAVETTGAESKVELYEHLARWSYQVAEAMEAERERRIRGGE